MVGQGLELKGEAKAGMSDTPRTDEVMASLTIYQHAPAELVKLCRHLEREVNEIYEALRELETEFNRHIKKLDRERLKVIAEQSQRFTV